MHNYCTPHTIKENFENFLLRRCNYILLSQVYCVWQVVKTPTIPSNNPVFYCVYLSFFQITSQIQIIYTNYDVSENFEIVLFFCPFLHAVSSSINSRQRRMNQNNVNIRLINIKQTVSFAKFLFSFTFQVKTFPILGKSLSVSVYSPYRKHCRMKIDSHFIHVYSTYQHTTLLDVFIWALLRSSGALCLVSIIIHSNVFQGVTFWYFYLTSLIIIMIIIIIIIIDF
jgi:hypothetical protein